MREQCKEAPRDEWSIEILSDPEYATIENAITHGIPASIFSTLPFHNFAVGSYTLIVRTILVFSSSLPPKFRFTSARGSAKPKGAPSARFGKSATLTTCT